MTIVFYLIIDKQKETMTQVETDYILLSCTTILMQFFKAKKNLSPGMHPVWTETIGIKADYLAFPLAY